ncbi:MAG: hypothetical protein GWO11_02620 [Desulfuromonadales bacterium]|nr:hypothetical protein [Desulfuromonadales bacterium]NIR33370.1 hypothetical protein [Desulfuromonadales bacterium]NIS43362.1 hypothetical protein [Desulfuromonadales bacterium]
MPNTTFSSNTDSALPAEEHCPFLQRGRRCCSATFSSHLEPVHRKPRFCCSEDFDLCPLFLAKVLRDTHLQRARKLSASPSLL